MISLRAVFRLAIAGLGISLSAAAGAAGMTTGQIGVTLTLIPPPCSAHLSGTAPFSSGALQVSCPGQSFQTALVQNHVSSVVADHSTRTVASTEQTDVFVSF